MVDVQACLTVPLPQLPYGSGTPCPIGGGTGTPPVLTPDLAPFGREKSQYPLKGISAPAQAGAEFVIIRPKRFNDRCVRRHRATMEQVTGRDPPINCQTGLPIRTAFDKSLTG
jgi:hypothetical protein